MNTTNLLSLRLTAQHLSSNQWDTAHDTVRHFGAVQSQDFSGALWAVGMRTKKAKAVDITAAFADGSILRTHVMRPTWHFVAAEDITWLLNLTKDRVLQSLSYQFKKFQLDETLLKQTDALIAQEVAGGNYQTRKELATFLAGNNIDVSDMTRLSHIVFHAELTGHICSGPPRNKQQTYALVTERVPHAIQLERTEALAELARRYFKSHGPATVDDFSWWSGLMKQEAKDGLRAVLPELRSIEIAGKEYWLDKNLPELPPQKALLLPNYDEYIVAYANRDSLFSLVAPERLDSRQNPLFNNILILDGQAAATWKKIEKKDSLALSFIPFRPFTAKEVDEIQNAAARYASYLQLSRVTIEGIN